MMTVVNSDRFGTAVEDSAPHPSISDIHSVRVALPTVNIREEMDKFATLVPLPSEISYSMPVLIPVTEALTKRRYAINPRFIQWAVPSCVKEAEPLTMVTIEGMKHPLVIDMKYDDFMLAVNPPSIVSVA